MTDDYKIHMQKMIKNQKQTKRNIQNAWFLLLQFEFCVADFERQGHAQDEKTEDAQESQSRACD